MTDAPIDLSNFVTGADQIKPSDSGFPQPDAGTYKYTVADLRSFKSKDNSKTYLAIDLMLDNGMKFGQVFQMPKVYGQETQAERDTIARYLRMLVDLGVPADQANKPLSADTIKGWTGTLTIVDTPAKDSSGRIYKNIRGITPTPVGQPSRQTQDAGYIAAPTASPAPAQPAPSTNPFA